MLHDYQLQCVNKILSQDSTALFLEMGLGKSRIALTAMKEYIIGLQVSRCLIVAPKLVAEETWHREIEKWDDLNFLKYSRIIGDEKSRLKALKEDASFYIISRDNVSWLYNTLKANKDLKRFDALIADELSSFKNPKSARFKALAKLRGGMTKAIGLTGTPISNAFEDLWAEIGIVDAGKALGGNYYKFRNEYFIPDRQDYRGTIYSYRLKDGAKEAILSKISGITITMRARDYLSLEEPYFKDITVSLDAKNQAEYERFEKDLVLSVDMDTVAASSRGVLVGKLQQFASGKMYTDSGDDRRTLEIHDRKKEAFETLMEFMNRTSVIVFYAFQFEKEIIEETAKAFNRRWSCSDFEGWNRGEIDILILHPASAGFGLNLQDGGHTIIWYTLPWSLELYNQANARLHRQGQKSPVCVIRLIVDKTVDESIKQALESKEQRQADALSILKARQEAVARLAYD